MGCLNPDSGFEHWFGNIHLSGPCNRHCYFCIGQHMMVLDPLNNLDTWPLLGIDKFVEECHKFHINEINVTGTNTDPLLYKHTKKLKEFLQSKIPGLVFGVRTNGILLLQRPEIFELYDKGSITVCSFNSLINQKMMGGNPADLLNIVARYPKFPFKVNIVLGPEQTIEDIQNTIFWCNTYGIKKINLREPYGQAHVGNPLATLLPDEFVKGMPTYYFGDTKVTYWDVHFVEVESVNLYAQGRVSVLYPITKGHAETGEVKSQDNFTHGRHREQWIKDEKVTN